MSGLVQGTAGKHYQHLARVRTEQAGKAHHRKERKTDLDLYPRNFKSIQKDHP